jgi:hypothetical protein
MSSETDDLCVGLPRSGERPTPLTAGQPPAPESSSTDQLLPSQDPPSGKSGISSTSADGLTESLSQLSPDPYLDEFKPDPTVTETGMPAPGSKALGSRALDAIDLDVPPSAEIPAVNESSRGIREVVGALDLGMDRPVAPAPSSSQSFPTLDLYAPPPSQDAEDSAQTEGAAKDSEDSDEEWDDHLPWWCSPRIVALVFSYASAVTLGLIWVLWSHRTVRDGPGGEPDPFVARTRTEAGHRAGQSRKFIPPAPLPADRIVSLGQTVRLRSLEVTPLEVASGTVILKREIKQREARRGGNDALMLKLRLKNASDVDVFAPLDEEFLRGRAEGIRDSFIELGPTQEIAMFPLAIVSEWSIAGQEFRELDPGEWYETAVVSAPDVADHIDPDTMITWRIRLRVDSENTTEILGIRFRTSDIQRRPAHALPDPHEPAERPTSDDDRPGAKGDR